MRGMVRLARTLVTADGAVPARWAFFLHGLFGSGDNWQGFARKLVAARPEWGAVLLDLRLHGDSLDVAPPHTLAAAAADVRETVATGPGPARAVIGHSLGGKIALLLGAEPPAGLEQIWVLDASPSARHARGARDLTQHVFDALAALPERVASRREFVLELGRRGVDEALGLWLAKNLVREDGGLRFALDLSAIAELLADFDRSDLWSLLTAPPPGIGLHVVIGGRSMSISASDRERLQQAAEQDAIELLELPEAGHFLHVDDPEGLLRLVVAGLP
jgi:pimeloyl-ACP methyl ester carboxylesterase